VLDVSIIIVSWNTKQILKDCLESVFRQQADFEVIVVDNASDDGSTEMVKNDFPQVLLLTNRENRGFAAANNQGLKIAKGRYILLLNSDTLVLGDCISPMVSFADARPDVGIAGCQVLNPDRTTQPTCFMFPSLVNMFLSSTYLYKFFPRNRFFGREQMTWWDREDFREVDVVTGCFMFVRRQAIEQVGLMDESFFMYGEETDWCFRFKTNGWKVMFAPVGRIIHLGAASTSKAADCMKLQLYRSILQFMHKYRSRPVYTAACGFAGLFFLVRIPVWLVKASFPNSRRSRSLSNAAFYLKGLTGLFEFNRRGAFYECGNPEGKKEG